MLVLPPCWAGCCGVPGLKKQGRGARLGCGPPPPFLVLLSAPRTPGTGSSHEPGTSPMGSGLSVGCGRGTTLGASSQRGSPVRAPRGEGPREGPDALSPISPASLCCGRTPLAWGSGWLTHTPCEREGSPVGSGLALFIWRQRRNLTRQVCLLRGPGFWGSGSLVGGLLNPFSAKAKWFCLMGFWGLFLED